MTDNLKTRAQLLAELSALRHRIGELEQQRVHDQTANVAHILNLNRLYATLSQINQTIVRVRDRETLFTEICQVTIESGQFRLAWLGLIDETEQRIKPIAAAGEAQAYLANAEFASTVELLGHGPVGLAWHEGRAAICQDIATDTGPLPWRDWALAHGLRSTAAVPIRQAGRVIGTLALYAAEPQAFTQAVSHLLDEIGLDVSYALDMLEQAQ